MYSFEMHYIDWHLKHFQWNVHQVNAAKPDWWWESIDSGTAFVLLDTCTNVDQVYDAMSPIYVAVN